MLNEKLTTRLLENFNRTGIDLNSAHFLLAISGGPDSVALFHLCRMAGITFTALHCNYNLRGEDSLKDEKFVKDLCLKHQIKVLVKSFKPGQVKGSAGVQESARNLRYEWFKALVARKEGDFLLTAHHADDASESLMINLMRGTGIRGLAGIPFRRDYIIRPLINFTKEELKEFMKVNQFEFRVDLSNTSPDYLRNRVRNELIPLMENIRPGSSKKLRDQVNYFDRLGHYISVQLQYFEDKHTVDEKIIVPYGDDEDLFFLWLQNNGFRPDEAEAVISLGKGQPGARIRGRDFTAFSAAGRWELFPNEDLADSETMVLIDELPFEYSGERTIELFKSNERVEGADCFDLSEISFPLILRSWKAGDRIRPFGMQGSRKLSDLLNDFKLSQPHKKQVLVLESGGQILSVPGYRRSDLAPVGEKTKEILVVRLRPLSV